MAFGLDAGISRETSCTVQTAQKPDEIGTITEVKTYGGTKTTTEEVFSSSFSNVALNGQTGSAGTPVYTEHTLIESNEDYAKERKVSMEPLPDPV